ncbi:590_t:CDS:1, partial [Dentiscutata erythropus]
NIPFIPMSQKTGKKIKYCPAGHSSREIVYSDCHNFIYSSGRCDLCTREHFIQEFKTWSSGNSNIDKIIQESQINNIYYKLQWIPYDNFQNIEYIADGGIKENWNFIKQDWKYHSIDREIALKEILDSRFDIAEFLKV